MSKLWAFDKPYGKVQREARQALLLEFLPELKQQLMLQTALDVGCGIGYFSKHLRDMGFRVVAFDGRHENVEEAKSRYPQIEFLVADAEDLATQRLGAFDLVLCFGLLYHLENPFRAIRHLHALTAKVMLIESVCVPQRQPMLWLLEENKGEDQGLRYVAFYPSETCLVKMCYRSGFKFVYRLAHMPSTGDFKGSLVTKKCRTMLAASKIPLNSPFFIPVPPEDPKSPFHPWTTVWGKTWHYIGAPFQLVGKSTRRFIGRGRRFVHMTWREKFAALRFLTFHR